MTPYQVVVSERPGKPHARAGVNMCKTDADTLARRLQDAGYIADVRPCNGLTEPLFRADGFEPIINLEPLIADRQRGMEAAASYLSRCRPLRHMMRELFLGLCGR